jgi:hypothetical protein
MHPSRRSSNPERFECDILRHVILRSGETLPQYRHAATQIRTNLPHNQGDIPMDTATDMG